MSDDEKTGGVEFDPNSSKMPRWIWKAVIVFWLGFLATILIRYAYDRLFSLLILLLVSLFLALAIEPGVTRLARRGWPRGRSTLVILLGVVAAVLIFVVAIGTLVGTQVADLLQNSERYVNRTVDFLNNTFGANIDAGAVNDSIQDPNGSVQEFIRNRQDDALQLSVTALGLLLQGFSVMLFSFYLVADGPRMRRAICSRLPAARQQRVLDTWDLAIDKTGGYLYSRALLAGASALVHWIAFQSIGTAAPVALAIWVGLISQFIPVIGTYVAGVLPILLTFIDSPIKALAVVLVIILYQQLENFLIAPRITARTMEIHPAVSFGSAIAGAALLGPVGAVLALPVAAMAVAVAAASGERHELIDNPLVRVPEKKAKRRERNAEHSAGERRRFRRGRGA
ncbi:MAG: AI-2E family transporter [Acidimicrobiales bacterium mtb01]|nr:AI-2E family transporter [Actinomycetota bacterium]TEX46734.1 MAG: AI-2E family transporter [Acidimicrobiales bacterium mtb01]